ncbi:MULTISPECIES: hypothetical protein, partial [unclassified Pseudomonas]
KQVGVLSLGFWKACARSHRKPAIFFASVSQLSYDCQHNNGKMTCLALWLKIIEKSQASRATVTKGLGL